MDFSRVAEAKRIVLEARELPSNQRAAYIREACGEDTALQDEVEAYLAVSTGAAAVFDEAPFPETLLPGLHYEPGDEIDHYLIERFLGQGGMGAVYSAHDTTHRRSVALKILLPHAARYSSHERETLARLNHPNIATLYGSGRTSEGFQYLAMEYVDGEPIDDYCATRRLPLRERLRLFGTVCRAVHYAHSQLVAHRDLKPSNILVTEDGTPTLLDFGVAKVLSPEGDATLTRPHERPLTIAFSSPEQLDGKETGAATDIYSLGVLLAALLTGRLPYRVQSPHELAAAIRRGDPTRPSSLVAAKDSPGCSLSSCTSLPVGGVAKLRRELQGDLDAIVLCALRGEPLERYSSAQELAEDVRRYLATEPVSARRGSQRYRAIKFIRRHTGSIVSVAVAILILVGFALVLAYQRAQTAEQRDAAQLEAKRAETVSEFLTEIFQLSDPWENSSQEVTAKQLLDESARTLHARLRNQPELHAKLASTLATVYTNLGAATEAEQLLRVALSQTTRAIGPRHPAVSELHTSLATALREEGRYAQARSEVRKALSVLQVDSEELSLPMAEALHALAAIDFADGKVEDARNGFQRVLQLQTALLGESDDRTAETLNDLAVCFEKLGDLEKGEQLQRQALEVRTELSGPGSLQTSQSMNNLAVILVKRGDYTEAEKLYRDALAIRQDLLGMEHPSTLQVLNNLAGLFTRLRRNNEAAATFAKIVALRRKALGSDHPKLAETLTSFGHLEESAGDFSAAESLYAEALSIFDLSVPPGHPNRLSAIRGYADLLSKEGRHEEAEALAREVLEIDPSRLPRSYVTIQVFSNLSYVFSRQGKSEEALSLLQRARAMAVELRGDDSEPVGMVELSIALLHLKADNVEAARETAEHALATLTRLLPSRHPSIRRVKLVLAQAFRGSGKLDAAEPLFLEILEDVEQEPRDLNGIEAKALAGLVALYEARGESGRAADYRYQLRAVEKEEAAPRE